MPERSRVRYLPCVVSSDEARCAETAFFARMRPWCSASPSLPNQRDHHFCPVLGS